MNRRQTILAAAALAAITVLVYLPAMRNGFVWDDREMAIDNPLVKSAGGLGEIWLGKNLPEYHPLTYSVFWLEWRLWGANPAGWHVINILLHAADVALLWLVLRKLRVPGSWLAALLFGAHPVCAASAAWIAELKNTLSMLFYLAALLFYLRSGEAGERVDRRWRGAALGAFALALLAKVSVVVLPVVLLLIAWWRGGAITRWDLARTIPFFLLAAAAGLCGMTFQNRYTGLNDPLPERLLGGGWAVWFYLWKILWPVHLTVIYPRWQFGAARAADWIPAACFAAMLFVFWRNRRGWGRACLFGVGYFVIALAPVLGVFKMAFLDFSQVADHLQYLAAPGIIALVVAGGCRWLPTDWGRVAAVLVVVMFSGLTWRNEGRYADMGTFWRENLASNPNSFQAMIYVGSQADKEKRYAEAEVLFKRVLALRPDSLEGNYNMGVLLDDEGRVDEAMRFEEKALRIKPDQADAHILLAWCLAEKGRDEEAMAHLREAIRYAPEDFRAHQNLGNLLAKHGRDGEAVQELGEVLRLKSDDPAIYVALGFAQGRRGKLAEAQACFQKALSLDPANAEARKGLDAVLQSRTATNAPAGR
ncbi:MAG: tetratricopeptide repeat protein [Verrucomicrobiota bacterium]|jgi:tetratricopeptide (TPR) repeat protein